MSVLLPGLLIASGSPFIFGGGKPVPINPSYFLRPRRDFMLVALAGPISNLLLAALCCLAWVGLVYTEMIPPYEMVTAFGSRIVEAPSMMDGPRGLLESGLYMAVVLNLLLAVFNLVPVPPLDGSRVVGWALPEELAQRWYGLDRAGIILVLVLFFAAEPLLGFNFLDVVFEGLEFLAGAYFQATEWLLGFKVYS